MASGRRGFGDGKRDSDAIDNTGPIDVMAVRRDDALLDAIAGDGPVATDSNEEYQLAMLLANWRADVVSSPMPAGPDLDTVVAAVNQEIGARQVWLSAAQRRSRLRLLRPLGVAAASIAVIAGGMMAFSYNAQPGDPLWKFKQVVFSEQANSTVAQQEAGTALNEAQHYIEQGDTSAAKANLDHAANRLGGITDSHARDQLQDRLNKLQQQLSPSGTPSSGGTSSSSGGSSSSSGGLGSTGHSSTGQSSSGAKPGSSTSGKPGTDSSTAGGGSSTDGSTGGSTGGSAGGSVTLSVPPATLAPGITLPPGMTIPTFPPIGPSHGR